MTDMEKTLPERDGIFGFVYETELTKRIDAVHNAPFYFTWIDTAWAVMLIKQGILPKDAVPDVVDALWTFWQEPDKRYAGFGGLEKFVIATKGQRAGGSLTISRTIPPLRQMFPIRHQLMKVICMLHDLEDALLDEAERHVETVMPGYTHYRHAQPTTYGHYLLSVFDPIDRTMAQVEAGYQAMSLNEIGCGALAGTSMPIDRNLVSDYLALEGLIENANDAVSYTDGYVTLVAALANLMAVVSRMALDLNVWSTLEYGFMHVPWVAEPRRSHSHLMPNKTANSPFPERSRVGAAEVLGCLTEIAAMSMRAPHQDTHEMLHMRDATERALKATHDYTHVWIYTLPRITVNKGHMLDMARQGFSCSTELANRIVRDYELDYRTAHEIVCEFVHVCEESGIPASEAYIEDLERQAERVLGKRMGMSQAMLRQALDPEHFVQVTKSQGGVAPNEARRMVGERRCRMEAARERHEHRVQKLERAKARLEAALRECLEAI